MEIDAQHRLFGPPPPPPPPPMVHSLPSATCDLHPDETVTGFCASCLRERLAGLEASAAAAGRKSTSALKSAFLRVSGGGGGGERSSSSSASSFFRPQELRRCKSFSFARCGGGGDALSGPRTAGSSFEPQRRSCDMRGRSTLWSLFHQDNHGRARDAPIASSSAVAATVAAAVASVGGEVEAECRNLGFTSSSVAPPVPETREEEEEEDGGDEIRPVEPVLVIGTSSEIEQCQQMAAEKEAEEKTETKPMKVHIDLDAQQQPAKKPAPKDLKEIAGSFWLAASVFSKKLQKWRRKQKLKKQGSKAAAAAMPGDKPEKTSRRFRDTQSEMAVDAFGRRSCDTDPRFSLDAGRMSLDDPRFSWDEPRASWDGYLIGGSRPVLSRLHPMLSVVEDSPVPAVPRSDSLIPVEEDAVAPGCSTQTRDYYLDSSSQRRRSLDRSSSIREQPIDINEPKLVSNAKVTPAGNAELFHFHQRSLLVRDSKEWSSNSLRDDYSASFESAFSSPRKRVDAKKPRKWSKAWNIWGFIQRRSSSKGGADVVERSFSETWPELRSRPCNGKISRSNSSRSSFSSSSRYGSMRRTSVETNGHNRKRKEELVLERNRSARYSPSHADNGMLRFYLTPMRMRNSRRKGGSGNGRPISSHYITRSMIGLY